ncbi:MAG: flagellar FliJ family protein [Desulfotomaculum sp.]|nr:flagellar FliJ family protein [Desulfotomaculum sp.]MCL0080855.1 flagellar FliJ family protein [Peptococcaceae bacterium]
MQKFQFRLEPVLKQRNTKECEALLKQSQAEKLYRERLAVQVQAEKCLNECAATTSGCQSCSKQTAPPEQIQVGSWQQLMYQENLKLKINQQKQQVQLAQQQFHQACQVTTEARQQRMVLEKLKEGQLQTHLCQARVLEEKNIDELATGMYNYQCRLKK